jgi:murein DD-endopeptidase MepM/ murein hydrolase activator NlpD
MDIIVVSEKLAKARTITISVPLLGLTALTVIAAVAASTTVLNYALLRYAAESKIPYVQRLLLPSGQQEQTQRTESYVRENLNTMAVHLGQMQAQLLRLDTLGERLAKIAGFRPQDLMFGQTPGQGGAISSAPSQDLSLGDLTQQLEALTRQVDDRSDKLGVLESIFTLGAARRKLVPTESPVHGAWHSSDYGWRIDPFSGQRAFHEGVDFLAGEGTAITAAAGGVVVYADLHPQYGNMIEIDHGNDLVSRYAHASRLLVKIGDLVLSGAKIAEVGRTGRATGTHLHFEVRHRGVPQNPTHFLRQRG